MGKFVELAENFPNVEVRFLEYMPFSGNSWERSKVLSEKDCLNILSRKFDKNMVRLPPESLHDVAKFYTLPGYNQQEQQQPKIGFISTITSPFCGGCNRVRVTADGFMKNCLFSENEVDLKSVLHDQDMLLEKILENIKNKKFSRNLDKLSSRPMVRIGG